MKGSGKYLVSRHVKMNPSVAGHGKAPELYTHMPSNQLFVNGASPPLGFKTSMIALPEGGVLNILFPFLFQFAIAPEP